MVLHWVTFKSADIIIIIIITIIIAIIITINPSRDGEGTETTGHRRGVKQFNVINRNKVTECIYSTFYGRTLELQQSIESLHDLSHLLGPHIGYKVSLR